MASLIPTALRKAAYRQKFVDNEDDNLFMGSFSGFDAAIAEIPAEKQIGYDNAAAATTLYSHQIHYWDYPALFWIGRSLAEGMRTVFDLGGHVGIKYYAFKRLLQYPANLNWRVCDVPGVVEAGRALAAERQAAQLGFTTDWQAASGADVLYASGSLQYLPTRIGDMLAAMPAKPKRLLLNITAVHPERTLYSLNSIGVAICPYRIQHHDELLSEITAAGYVRRDAWRNEGKPISVPFVPGGDQPFFAGCCFDLATAGLR